MRVQSNPLRLIFGNEESGAQVRRVEMVDDIRLAKVTDEDLSPENKNLGEIIRKTEFHILFLNYT